MAKDIAAALQKLSAFEVRVDDEWRSYCNVEAIHG
jgi:hypothetical protein